jgi:hypothetical protein
MLEQPKRVQSDYPIEETFDEVFEESFEGRFDQPFGEPSDEVYGERSDARHEEPLEDNIARPLFARSRYSRPGAPFAVVSEDSIPDSIPLFLSGDADRPDEQVSEPSPEVKRVPSPRTLKIALLAAGVAGIIFGLFAVEDTRAVIANAKASLAGEPASNAQPSRNPVPTLPAKIQAALSERPSAPATTAPTREQIAMAYQAALQGQQVQGQQAQALASMQPAQPVPPAQVAEPDPQVSPAPPATIRRIEPDELANLLNRAKGLLAIGDVSAARLLLVRAADGQEAQAALLLARTYDPQVLRSSDSRTTSPDPKQARFWYGKAAEFGSPDAQRRLAELEK